MPILTLSLNDLCSQQPIFIHETSLHGRLVASTLTQNYIKLKHFGKNKEQPFQFVSPSLLNLNL